MTESQQYSIRAFADIFGLTPATVRYYESLGLISPQRSVNQRRFYTEKDVDWMRFILHLKNTGMSMEQLQQYVLLRSQGDVTIAERLELLLQTRDDFLQQQAKLQKHLQILNDKIEWYQRRQQGLLSEQVSFAEYLISNGHSL
ncbi:MULTISPECIES: MerR family transcriptional regulator [Snodgrassella]|uniref:MerR family transcriptional regulator n=2 Tax=Snodgrassella alvi TaxID=1196083 RepID=A0A1X0TIY7_9NEIS|nr:MULTISPECIES: MerR family transcriptional regulator [Snodgrassella]KEQ00091.1 putative transcriptional regulator [Snodgrassella alvi SCGC AB-598-J21]AHN29449.1 Transcriptional regulator, MerR family [Snodgrassella alvi wkB2]MBI0068164.1 MerR family transcriptional regulator [Snodgrassella sp. M0110]MBI0077195.1 MerR family transcriptional regulator [Snodgrassella sp. M0118]MBI0079464.1 MerR family transcriptional regulator [Snodgrassella sp. M0112]